METLHIQLLGTFEIRYGETPLADAYSARLQSLLAYLLLYRDVPQSRQHLAFLFWPDSTERQARTNLRNLLLRLRETLPNGDRFLRVEGQVVQWRADAPFVLDVADWELALTEAEEAVGVDDRAAAREALERATALYRGDLLPGCYDDWILPQRERLQQLFLDGLFRLACLLETEHDYLAAIESTQRLLRTDPLHEPGNRVLMRLHALTGNRAGAMQVYDACAAALQRELGVEPEPETTTLYERIRAGEELKAGSALPPHNLPAELTPFVGRKALLSEIVVHLQDPDCRLLTLVGPGGSGKTRLARQAAKAFLSKGASIPFQDGVFFVSLAPLRSSEGVVPTIGSSIGFPFYEGGTPKQQLLDYLQRKQMLIILDNFEHLLSPPQSPQGGASDRVSTPQGTSASPPSTAEAASLVLELLHTAPGIKILATSRTRLSVRGEHLLPIEGMHYPERVPETASELEPFSAVQLFLSSTREVRAGFEPKMDEMEHVIRICQLVEGMPLALLLAAAWMEMLTPAEIAHELESKAAQAIDFLATDWREVPERQRSMRAVFDYSWSLLNEREQAVSSALSVFRGGFTRQAAEQVAGASLRELMDLLNKSLLHRTPAPSTALPSTSLRVGRAGRTDGRYELHELLRQYAAEKLAEDQAVRDRHCDYYASALQAWAADLEGPRHQAALSEMETEYENARTAWGWAAAHGQIQRLDQALEGLAHFYRLRCRHHEGAAAMSEAACRLQAVASDVEPALASPTAGRVLARILAWQSFFCAELGQTELARRLLSQGEALLEQPAVAAQDIRREKAFVLMTRGLVAYNTSHASARGLLAQSLALYRDLADQARAAQVLLFLGGIAFYAGDPDAENYFQESLEIRRALGNPVGVAEALTGLGHTFARQQPERAEPLRHECLALYRETGDRFAIAQGLHYLGGTLLYCGKFPQAHSAYRENAHLYGDLGARRDIAAVDTMLGFTQVHLGEYDQAGVQISGGLDLAREIGHPRMIGLALVALGHARLALDAHAEAERLLQEAVALYRELAQREYLEWALACLGHAELALGKHALARQHLCQGLRADQTLLSVRLLATAFSGIALLFADQGQPVRALELYALASCYPYVAHSRWFEDVAGRQIAALAATLPPEVIASAQERGRARDLWATVGELPAACL